MHAAVTSYGVQSKCSIVGKSAEALGTAVAGMGFTNKPGLARPTRQRRESTPAFE
jgi:hypothetical protein